MPGPVDLAIRPRRVWAALLLALLLAGAVMALGEGVRSPSPTEALPEGADSTTVVQLQQELPQADGDIAVVLWTADSGTLTEQQLGAIRADYPQLQPSQDGTAAVSVVPIVGDTATEVAEKVTELRKSLQQEAPAGTSAQVTGPAAIEADLSAVFDGANFRLLGATAAVVAILLIVTYRSPVLWLIPLLVVGTADRAAAILGTRVLEWTGVPWDESTTGILSVLVFGAGTDYALLLISRYRDELRSHADRFVAMRTAVRATAEPVFASSVTVFLGLLTLLLSVFPTTRGLGLACAVGVLVAAFGSLVVLPFALVVFGRWIFWPVVPREGQPSLADSRSLWGRIGHAVDARPRSAVALTLVVLAVLASGALGIRIGLSNADQFLDKPEAISASERLAESFPAGFSDPTVIITRADPGTVQRAAEAVPGVDTVTQAGAANGLTKLDVVLAAGSGSPQAEQAVRDLRAATAGFDATWVGGTEAQSLDQATASDRDRWVILPTILGLVTVALLLLLRSLVAPLLLVASVVVTYAAALGASWWLFTGAFGFERLADNVPLFSFLFLVALGVDYNIFLVTRAAEEARTHGSRIGMLRGLSATGGVITSAGILLAAVFAVLGVLPLVVLAQIGAVICVGVLLDTLVVRTVLVPALAVSLGDRFWWPRRFAAADAPSITH